MGAAEKLRMTYAEYLVAEEASETKNEYLRGEVFAMAGTTFEHALIAMNLGGELRQRLTGRCVVVGSDARVRIEATDRATYPDLMIVCGPRHAASEDRHGTVNPTLIVEVLSDSTERDDRGEKFAHYRQISSLREYVLVAQKEARVEVFTREAGDSGVWRFSEAVGEGIVRFASVDVVVPLEEVYRGVAFAAAPADG
jgi:Uma2 family endonuclease